MSNVTRVLRIESELALMSGKNIIAYITHDLGRALGYFILRATSVSDLKSETWSIEDNHTVYSVSAVRVSWTSDASWKVHVTKRIFQKLPNGALKISWGPIRAVVDESRALDVAYSLLRLTKIS